MCPTVGLVPLHLWPVYELHVALPRTGLLLLHADRELLHRLPGVFSDPAVVADIDHERVCPVDIRLIEIE
jgi:hypothetical protein